MTAYTDFHYSPTGSGVISGSQVLEQTEQGINGLGQYVQDNISGAIDTANQALTIAQTANTNATTALNTANSFSDAITTANQTANNALTTAQSAQSTANAASSLATTANNNATSALNAANAATSNVNILTSTVNGLGNRMTAAENAINANAGNITTLQNNLATTNANVTAASNAANAAQATATSAQATATLARNQAYVLRYTATTITGGGTIAYADIDNTDNIKAGDKIIDISGAIYAIASVDIANETVTVSASEIINLAVLPDLFNSANTWTGAQTYGAYLKSFGEARADEWSGNSRTNAYLLSRRDTDDVSGFLISTFRQNAAQGTAGHIYGWDILENSTRYSGLRFTIDWDSTLNSGNGAYRVTLGTNTQGTNPCNDLHITQLKTINGINPGALSLPDIYDSYDVVTTNWSTAYNQPNDLKINGADPSYPGWLFIRLDNCTAADDFVIVRYFHVNATNLTFFGSFIPTASSYVLSVPIQAGITTKVWVSKIPTTCKYYACLGTVK